MGLGLEGVEQRRASGCGETCSIVRKARGLLGDQVGKWRAIICRGGSSKAGVSLTSGWGQSSCMKARWLLMIH